MSILIPNCTVEIITPTQTRLKGFCVGKAESGKCIIMTALHGLKELRQGTTLEIFGRTISFALRRLNDDEIVKKRNSAFEHIFRNKNIICTPGCPFFTYSSPLDDSFPVPELKDTVQRCISAFHGAINVNTETKRSVAYVSESLVPFMDVVDFTTVEELDVQPILWLSDEKTEALEIGQELIVPILRDRIWTFVSCSLAKKISTEKELDAKGNPYSIKYGYLDSEFEPGDSGSPVMIKINLDSLDEDDSDRDIIFSNSSSSSDLSKSENVDEEETKLSTPFQRAIYKVVGILNFNKGGQGQFIACGNISERMVGIALFQEETPEGVLINGSIPLAVPQDWEISQKNLESPDYALFSKDYEDGDEYQLYFQSDVNMLWDENEHKRRSDKNKDNTLWDKKQSFNDAILDHAHSTKATLQNDFDRYSYFSKEINKILGLQELCTTAVRVHKNGRSKYIVVVSANTNDDQLVLTGKKTKNTGHAESLTLKQIYHCRSEGWEMDMPILRIAQHNSNCDSCANLEKVFNTWREAWNLNPSLQSHALNTTVIKSKKNTRKHR